MMEELMFPMDTEAACVVPRGAGVGFGGDGGLFSDDLNFYPQSTFDTEQHTICSSSFVPAAQGFCTGTGTSRSAACISDNPLLGSNNDWLESSSDWSGFFGQEQEVGSPNSSVDRFSVDDPCLKSQMEIYREIEQEAAKYSPPVAVPSSPPNLTTLISMEVVPSPEALVTETCRVGPTHVVEGTVVGSPSMPVQVTAAAPVNAFGFVCQVGGSDSTSGLVSGSALGTAGAVQQVLAQQAVAAPQPVAPEPAFQVVQVVGNNIVFPDGTSAVILRNPSAAERDTIAISDEESEQAPWGSEPMEQTLLASAELGVKKKRPYQTGSYERKKMQNRQSSFRYRLKKKAETGIKIGEYEGLANRNKELKKTAEDLVHEIAYWKKFMLELKSGE